MVTFTLLYINGYFGFTIGTMVRPSDPYHLLLIMKDLLVIVEG
jgi:hypothetical protein